MIRSAGAADGELPHFLEYILDLATSTSTTGLEPGGATQYVPVHPVDLPHSRRVRCRRSIWKRREDAVREVNDAATSEQNEADLCTPPNFS